MLLKQSLRFYVAFCEETQHHLPLARILIPGLIPWNFKPWLSLTAWQRSSVHVSASPSDVRDWNQLRGKRGL